MSDNDKAERVKIKKIEMELRTIFTRRILPAFNEQLNKAHISMMKELNICYDTGGEFEAIKKCKEEKEKEFMKKQEVVQFTLKTFQNEFQTCLGSCKSDLSQATSKCYQNCLQNFKEIADEM